MAVILDDIDARPGSVASLLRTVVGLYLRLIGGWIAAADLVALMGSLGVDAPQARTGIARLRSKGLLIADRRTAAGYALNPAAIPMLERGDRRIFGAPQMGRGIPGASSPSRSRRISARRAGGCDAGCSGSGLGAWRRDCGSFPAISPRRRRGSWKISACARTRRSS